MRRSERLSRLLLFGAVYFVEGAMLTYFSAFNVIYLRTFDMSYTRIGIISGISLVPFVLKIFIGLLSDKVRLGKWGYRKPYIVIGLLFQATAFFLLPLFNPVSQFPLYLMVMIMASLGMSTYDTCTDGFSIDTTPEADRGLVQGIMVGGRALSSVAAAAVIGVLSETGQWSLVFLLIAGLSVITLGISLLVREPAERPEPERAERGAFRSFLNWPLVLFMVLGMAYPLALYSANSMVGPFLNEFMSIPLDRVGVYLSVYGIGTIVGAAVGGPLMKQVGRRTSLLAALLITALMTFGLAAVPSPALAWAVVFLFGVAFGYYETVYFAMGMDFADPRIAAFMFSIFMAVGNLGIGLGQPLAGVLVDRIGFRSMFVVFAVVHLVTLPMVFGIFRLKKDESVEPVSILG